MTINRTGQHYLHTRLSGRLDRKMSPLVRDKTPQPDKEIAHFLCCRDKLLHRETMMDHTDKIKGIRHFCSSTLTDSNYWYVWGPFHIKFISLAHPGLHSIKRKTTMQGRYMGRGKRGR